MDSLIFRHGVFRVELVTEDDDGNGQYLSVTRDGEPWEIRIVPRPASAMPDTVEVRDCKNYMLALFEVNGPDGRNKRYR